jgi:uncharacterized protein YuzE
VVERAGHNARVSGKRRVTIPAVPFHEAGFEPGDILRVEADGAGRVVLTRIEELVNPIPDASTPAAPCAPREAPARGVAIALPSLFAYYDRDADIAWLPTGESDDVVSERVPGGLHDYDRTSRQLVAIEVWDASTRLPSSLLSALPAPC